MISLLFVEVHSTLTCLLALHYSFVQLYMSGAQDALHAGQH